MAKDLTPDDPLSPRLPALRVEEPAELRRDIADELADHLRCALRREQLHSGPSSDEAQAAAVVLDCFGNPQDVARRLWWDAMKERIMAYRILTAGVVAATGLCLVMCGLVWQMLRDNRTAQAALVESQRHWLEKIVAELRVPRTSGSSKLNLDEWKPLRIKLVDQQGAPAAGSVVCQGAPLDSEAMGSQPIMQSVTAGRDGIADLGLLPIGSYHLGLSTAHPKATTMLSVFHGLGRPAEIAVSCPAGARGVMPRFAVNIDTEGAESLAGLRKAFRWVVQFQSTSRPQSWSDQAGGPSWEIDAQTVATYVLDVDGQVLGDVPCPKVAANAQHATGQAVFPLRIGGEDLKNPPQTLTPGTYVVCLAPYSLIGPQQRKRHDQAKAAAAEGQPSELRVPDDPGAPLYSTDDAESRYAVGEMTIPEEGEFLFRIDKRVLESMEVIEAPRNTSDADHGESS